MKSSIPSRLHSGLWLAASALALAACTNVYYPPATGGAPVVDASVGSGTLPASNGTAPAQTAVPAAPVASDAPLQGLHLQAGTFSSHENADRMANSIRNKVPSLSAKVHVAPRNNNWRVLIGPFASEQERMEAGGRIRTETGNEVVNAAP